MKRFSYEHINQLWQADVMYGPYIKDGKKRKQTYFLHILMTRYVKNYIMHHRLRQKYKF
jgi:hypothetical protein